MEKGTIIKLTNRGSGMAVYTIPDMNLVRTFSPGETKEIEFNEIMQLSKTPGGMNLLMDQMIIESEQAVKEILGDVEPEYSYTEEDIMKLLTEGTNEQLMDTLDFAPKGVIDLIKDLSVKIKLNDMNKRQIILAATKFNVTRAIENDEASKELDEPEEKENKARRAAPINQKEKKSQQEPQQPVRRVVVNKNK